MLLRRNVVTLLAFFGFLNTYMHRVNLSVAIVAMTSNRTLTAPNGTEYQTVGHPSCHVMSYTCNTHVRIFIGYSVRVADISAFTWHSTSPSTECATLSYIATFNDFHHGRNSDHRTRAPAPLMARTYTGTHLHDAYSYLRVRVYANNTRSKTHSFPISRTNSWNSKAQF